MPRSPLLAEDARVDWLDSVSVVSGCVHGQQTFVRPPSVYVYFPSKHALYDALFARGARLLLAAMQEVFAALPARPATLKEILLPGAQAFVRWSVEHAAYSQLLFWRPVPGFTPSPEAYQAAVELIELGRGRLKELPEAGLLRPEVSIEQIERDWTILVSGVISQQLSNAPQQSFNEGHFTAAIPELTAMFADHYSPRGLAPERDSRRGHLGDDRRPVLPGPRAARLSGFAHCFGGRGRPRRGGRRRGTGA